MARRPSAYIGHARIVGRGNQGVPAFRTLGKHAIQRWLVASVLVAGAIVFSIRFVDRPLARALAPLGLSPAMANGTAIELPVMITLAGIAVAAGVWYLWARGRVPKLAEAATLAGIALLASICLVEFLFKPMFTRTVPMAFLWDHAYGFRWLAWGDGSFPSGHADQCAAILSVFWVYYPRLRGLYVLAMAVLAFALMAGEWHFFSDIIAGAFLGAFSGWLVLSVSRMLRARQSTAGRNRPAF